MRVTPARPSPRTHEDILGLFISAFFWKISTLLEDLPERAANFAQRTIQLALLARFDIAGSDDATIATVNG